jgi:hypothetical protein
MYTHLRRCALRSYCMSVADSDAPAEKERLARSALKPRWVSSSSVFVAVGFQSNYGAEYVTL